MPVSPVPLIFTFFVIITPVVSFILAFYYGKKVFIIGTCIAVLPYLAVLFFFYGKGMVIEYKAGPNNPEAQFQLARWKENHCEKIHQLILFPCNPDVKGGFQALQKAAKWNHPKATWLVGVRYKHGIFVPKPDNWTGKAGNVFPQPKRGQRYIDRSVNELGFDPPSDGVEFYWHTYRSNDPFE